MLETGTIVVLVIIFALFGVVGMLMKKNLSAPPSEDDE